MGGRPVVLEGRGDGKMRIWFVVDFGVELSDDELERK